MNCGAWAFMRVMHDMCYKCYMCDTSDACMTRTCVRSCPSCKPLCHDLC